MSYEVRRLKPFGVLITPHEKNTSIQGLDIKSLRNLFIDEQLLVLRGFKTFQTSQEFSDYCELWGEVCLWPFGKVLELVQQEHPEDHIFDHSYVPLHWDGMYRPQVPEYQIFHCVKAPPAGHGGRTLFSHTPRVLKNASADFIELWSKMTGAYQRKMEFYNSRTVSPIITRHPHRGFSVIRYGEPHFEDKGPLVNPPELAFTGGDQEELRLFQQSLEAALYHPDHLYAQEWQAGDVVIADNFSLLHGREAFTSKAPRHLQRVQVLSNPPFKNPGLEFCK